MVVGTALALPLLDSMVPAFRALAEPFAQRPADPRSLRHRAPGGNALRAAVLGANDGLTVDERKLEDKLVQAVKELYQSEMRRREATRAMK